MRNKKNIAIIMGGFSNEASISMDSGAVVYKHLNRSKYNVFRIHILKDKWILVADDNTIYPINKSDFTVILREEILNFDCVFNTIHGTPGEDGLIQGYFDLLQIPQTSSDFYQAALTFNKRDLISIVRQYGIKTARNFLIDKNDEINVDEIIDQVGLPCFVKANKAGSSFGISKAKHKKDIIPAINNSFEEDDEIIIESFLDGVEVDVGLYSYKDEITALPVTEIVTENEFFDYSAKYLGQSQEITPARITSEQTIKVQELSKYLYKKLKLKGLARAEFIFHNNEPHFIEINTTPGLSEESIIPKQAAAAGISLSKLFDMVVEDALQRIRE